MTRTRRLFRDRLRLFWLRWAMIALAVYAASLGMMVLLDLTDPACIGPGSRFQGMTLLQLMDCSLPLIRGNPLDVTIFLGIWASLVAFLWLTVRQPQSPTQIFTRSSRK